MRSSGRFVLLAAVLLVGGAFSDPAEPWDERTVELIRLANNPQQQLDRFEPHSFFNTIFGANRKVVARR